MIKLFINEPSETLQWSEQCLVLFSKLLKEISAKLCAEQISITVVFFFLRNRYGPLFNEEEGYAASDAATDDFYGM